jgi:DNA primase
MERGRDDTVERVREATDVVQLIGQYVNLKRAGRSFKGLCPFHNEKTPSFMVSPERQMYHCFGCHKGGDVFSFLMEHDGVSFVEALRTLGERAGVEVETRRPRDAGNDGLYDAAERAARFFVSRLERPEGEPVRRYVRKRGLSPAVVERFRLGAAPNAWEDLGRVLREDGVAEATLLALGLVARRAQAGGGVYDVFRNRLVIPIGSLSGRVVGFGGRVLPGADGEAGGPKYLNSSDSPIYHKGQLLYGLAEARAAIRRQDAVILTEGYLDFLSLFQAGLEHVVAACGTAFTPQQAALLQRYTHRAYILGDSDPAGRRAAVRTAGLLLEHGFLVYLVELPSGYDPDSFVREHGPAALETRVREAPSYIGAMKLLVDRRAGDLAVKERVLRHLLDDLARVADPVLRELYTAELGRAFGLSDAALAAGLEQRRGRSAAGRPSAAVAPAAPAAPAGAAGEAQRGLLRLGLQGPGWVERLAAVLAAEDFDAGPPRRLFAALVRAESGGWFDGLEDEADRSYATELALGDMPGGEPERLFQDYVAALKSARLEAAEGALRERLLEAERRGDDAETVRLLEEQRRLAQDRSGWKRRAAWN